MRPGSGRGAPPPGDGRPAGLCNLRRGGCFFHSARAHGHEAGLSALQVVDTTGAGDIFGGSAVWKLLQTGKAPQDLSEAELRGIVRFACTAAGLSTTKQGGLSSIPTLEQVQARLAEENRA